LDFRGSKGHISVIYKRISIGFGALSSVHLGLTSHYVEIDVSDNSGNYIFPSEMDMKSRAVVPDIGCA
jgi:hypothetical protein